MKALVRPEHQNAISLTKRYLQRRSSTSTSSLKSVAQDVMYTVTLGIGTPPQLFNLAIDTGSPITWVVNKTCSGDSCADIFNRFDCLSSPTCKSSPNSGILNASYVSGDGVVGDYVTDIFSLGSLSFSSLAGIVNSYNAQLPPTVDGIMGLWYTIRQYKKIPSNAAFLNVLKDSDALTQPLVGIWLDETNSTSLTTPGGEITFGGVDPSRFTGGITYVDCDPSAPWTIPVGSVSVNGKKIAVTSALATIDTGTSAMLLPEVVSDAINSAIPRSVKLTESADGIVWIIPCEGDTPVSFTFGNFTATIPYHIFAIQNIRYKDIETGALYCASSAMFATGSVSVISNWLLGDTLIKNVYTVFDFGTNAETGGRVGFAELTNKSSTIVNKVTTGGANIEVDEPIGLSKDRGNGASGGFLVPYTTQALALASTVVFALI
ncbi:hypothetical protein BX616_000810 [Lobosporangium transversale]|nr:hypothetical protein BX616_000810 [Lobosporangium transversale]